MSNVIPLKKEVPMPTACEDIANGIIGLEHSFRLLRDCLLKAPETVNGMMLPLGEGKYTIPQMFNLIRYHMKDIEEVL